MYELVLNVCGLYFHQGLQSIQAFQQQAKSLPHIVPKLPETVDVKPSIPDLIPENPPLTIDTANSSSMYFTIVTRPEPSVVRAFAHGAMDRRIDQRPWYVLSCLWDDAYKRTLAANQKE